MRFFIGMDWSRLSNRWRQNLTYPYILLSAGVVWSHNHSKKLRPYDFPKVKKIFIDSGGFSFFVKYSDYPYSVDYYVDFVGKMNELNNGKVKYVAIMDYPCEPSINRKAFKANKERIEKTVENAIKCFEHDITPAKWIPVLQGYTLDEYMYSLDLYKQYGILTDYIAIGSMCRRTDIDEIIKIVSEIRKEYKGKIHLFGLTLMALKNKALFDMIDSCDTISYTYGAKNEKEITERMFKLINTVSILKIKMQKQKTLIEVNKE